MVDGVGDLMARSERSYGKVREQLEIQLVGQ